MSILSEERYEKTGKKYPVRLILKVVGCSSGNWYQAKSDANEKAKRGRKAILSDEELLSEIMIVIGESLFNGEGYRKIWHRLLRKGKKADKERVNRIMRENGLLSPYRHDPATVRKRTHDGVIVTKAPNILWATDGKKFYVDELGWCWFFGVIDHFNDQLLSWHICKKGDRYAAMEPVRDAIRKVFGNVDKGVCKGLELKLRSDHGTQYDSNDFKREMEFLGLDMSKSFVRSPESNGCIERFNRTLEEEVFCLNHFRTLDEARVAIAEFIDNYNKDWLIGRLGYKSPLEYMSEFEQNKVALATA